MKAPRLRPSPLYGLTLVLSFCSILYELILAQSLSAVLGNTFLRYNVTIALYIASLGLGSLLCFWRARGDWVGRLIAVEWVISLLGAASPLLVHLWDIAVFRASLTLDIPFRGLLYQSAIHAFDHGLIVAIGVLSGFELPLLMRLAGRARSNTVLALDYGGTLAGAAAFPLLLLPGPGLLAAAAGAGLLNALCGFYLLVRTGRLKPFATGAFLAAVAACIALLILDAPLNQALSRTLYLPLP